MINDHGLIDNVSEVIKIHFSKNGTTFLEHFLRILQIQVIVLFFGRL
jgi:hypothetical protein